VDYKKPEIVCIEDASRAVRFTGKELAIPENLNPSHLPPSAGAYQADD